ncbi:MAG: PhzF family phenazine biosynthesis protein [Cyclobacteriaceae bacterium]|jgi:PhzF family phenazine biosynthesis protein
MKKIKRYQVDAFADRLFTGNPAVVCPLDNWLPDQVMQDIAMENNLSETAFYVHEPNGYRIRWFTPGMEVDLCGHATLATAFVLFSHEGYAQNEIHFQSRSGLLGVKKEGDWLTLDFPTHAVTPEVDVQKFTGCFASEPSFAFRGKEDYLLVFDTEEQIVQAKPDISSILKLDARAVIITAPGTTVDFVSRFFIPKAGINEDPVTGYAHTLLVPYWSKTLNKTEFTARQLSARGGFLRCRLIGQRVAISGQAKLFSTGEIYL